jgi:transcriptional regulator with XRE-family HTH domain
MDVVLKLRELRRMRGVTQKEVAELAGVGEKTVSSFETGERIMSMKLSQLFQLLSAYNITPAEFFGGGVEQQVFGELERLNATEVRLLTALRALPDQARSSLTERFLLMMDAAAMAFESRLRAVR